MKNLKSQSGISFFTIVFLLLIIGGATIILSKLLPVYVEFHAIDNIMESISEEHTAASLNSRALWKLIKKRLTINNIRNIKFEHLKIDRNKTLTTVTIKYEIRKPLIANLDLIAKYDNTINIIKK